MSASSPSLRDGTAAPSIAIASQRQTTRRLGLEARSTRAPWLPMSGPEITSPVSPTARDRPGWSSTELWITEAGRGYSGRLRVSSRAKSSLAVAGRSFQPRCTRAQGIEKVDKSSAETSNCGPLSSPFSRCTACWHAIELCRFGPAKHYANSRMTASTARLSPAFAAIFWTLPSRSAFRMFSIFMASTIARLSPAFTSCPSLT